MGLKQELLESIDSAKALAKECPQIIEIRSALRKLHLAHGLVSEADIPSPSKGIKKIEPNEAKKNTKKGGVQKK